MMKNESLIVLSYDAPTVEYSTIGKRKTGSSASSEEDAPTVQTGRIHCCVKSKPWDFTIGSVSGRVDFRKESAFVFKLLFDGGGLVESRTVDPLVCEVRPTKDGKSAVVEVRINVLSSQMEGALFRVRCTHSAMLECVTEPIKVVSKRSQLDKEKPKRTRTTQVATREAVLEMIERMEEQQKEHADMMQGVLRQNQQQAQLIERLLCRLEASALLSDSKNSFGKRVRVEQDDSCDPSQFIKQEDSHQDVDVTLQRALQRFVTMSQEEKDVSMSKLCKRMSAQETHAFHEMASYVIPAPPNELEVPLRTNSQNNAIINSQNGMNIHPLFW